MQQLMANGPLIFMFLASTGLLGAVVQLAFKVGMSLDAKALPISDCLLTFLISHVSCSFSGSIRCGSLSGCFQQSTASR